MHLTPQEIDKLVLHQAGFLAQKRLCRGLRLNYPEAVALIAAQLLELIRDGRSVAELMDVGRRILGRRQVMEGVAEMISEVQVEGTFPDGSKLVTVHQPICQEEGDMGLALYGSGLSSASASASTSTSALTPGEVRVEEGEIELNPGRQTITLRVENRGDRPVQVGSHFPFTETNRCLWFDRGLAYGMRLNIPAGTAVRFEPGETRTVELVRIGGRQVVHGGNVLRPGPVPADLTAAERRAVAVAAERRGFGHADALTNEEEAS